MSANPGYVTDITARTLSFQPNSKGRARTMEYSDRTARVLDKGGEQETDSER